MSTDASGLASALTKRWALPLPLKKALLPVHKKMESRIGAETIKQVYDATKFDPSKL